MQIKHIIFCLFLISCSTDNKDPLKNTKRLAREGHTSLYRNGAFEVPHTKIKLIPPGPEPLEMAKELSGVRAKESFFRYLSEAKEATTVVWEGSKKSYTFSKKIDHDLENELSKIAPVMMKSSKLVLKKSFAESNRIIGKSWEFAAEVHSSGYRSGKKIKKQFNQDSESFVKNFVIIPKKGITSTQVTFQDFVDNFKKSEEYRKKDSEKMTYLIDDSIKNYFTNIQQSFKKSDDEMENIDPNTGYSLASLKAMIWVLKGVMIDGVILPIGKMSAGAMGYVLVNGVAYPVLLISRNGVTSAQYAVEFVGSATEKTYEIIAPSLQVALASVLSSGINTAGFVIGNTVQYVGAPLASSGTFVVGLGSGAAIGVSGGVLSGATAAGSGVMAVSSEVLPKTVSTVTLVGGVTAYALKGSAEFAYEIGKATVVPPGMVLGGGLTLTYGSLVHLSAQSVLAVSDAAYLVLSLEGPKWVIYAVKGNLADNDHASGTILDLERMKQKGEEFYKVPATEEEIKKVVDELSNT